MLVAGGCVRLVQLGTGEYVVASTRRLGNTTPPPCCAQDEVFFKVVILGVLQVVLTILTREQLAAE